ncbi:hypothetical protein Trydic_g21474 [Trypoxylus dichotomus]
MIGALKYQSVTEQDWSNIVLLDESNFERNKLKFQEDNATTHKAVCTMTWFRENNISMIAPGLTCPTTGPEPHRTSMGFLNRKVERHTITSKKELKKLVDSPPKIISVKIKVKDGPTKY